MSLEVARTFLAWCAVLNYVVLIVWFWGFVLTHDWMFRIQSRWFHLSVERFDALNWGAIAVYKIGILLFVLVPFLALLIVG